MGPVAELGEAAVESESEGERLASREPPAPLPGMLALACNADDRVAMEEVRRGLPEEVTARDAGFAMLNMPAELGGRDLSMLGQVALEEEAGKATNGLGFAVVDRGPRELYGIATPDQIERYVKPIANGDYREAWALTEPGSSNISSSWAKTGKALTTSSSPTRRGMRSTSGT